MPRDSTWRGLGARLGCVLVACLVMACRAPISGAGGDGARVKSQPDGAVRATTLHDVLLVGNSVGGTVSVIDGRTFNSLGHINVVPDFDVRMQEIKDNPVRRLAFKAIKDQETIPHFEPAGGDRFVDDVFTSPDGTRLFVSRGNLGDIAAFDLTKTDFPIIWRTLIDGYKADHATISPDGHTIVVSASAALFSPHAEVLDAGSGRVIGSFETGLLPHQNDYSHNGQHIYNGSIGNLALPYALRGIKGPIRLTVVDATTLKLVRSYRFDFGIRPTVIADNESVTYAQLSYLNGLVKFDLTTGKIEHTLEEPLSEFAKANYPTKDDYPHNGAHHGLALSGDGEYLCDAGTIDNNVAIVRTADLTVAATLDVGLMPYWASTSIDGQSCFLTISGADAIAVIDYRAMVEVARVPVGKFPQRNRLGRLLESTIARLAADTQ